jgi:hypothetical protein
MKKAISSNSTRCLNITLQHKDTATCGCFVSHRLHNSNMNEKEYIDKYFKNKNKSPDEIVSDYCFKLLGLKTN